MAEENKTPDNQNPNGEGNQDPNAAGDKQGQQSEKKREFDQETRDFINSKYDEAYGKGFRKAEATLEPKLTEATSKIEQLQRELEAAKGGKGQQQETKKEEKKPEGKSGETDNEAVRQMQARLEELQAGINRLTTEKTEADKKLSGYEVERRESRMAQEFLKSIPDGIRFFDNDEVYTLIKPLIAYDDNGQVVVKNPKTGMPRLGRDLTSNMTLGELIAEFAERKPHLVKAPDTDGGTGAAETRRTSQKKSTEFDPEKATPAEFEAFLQQVKAGEASV